MKRLLIVFCVLLMSLASNAQSVFTLNNYLSTYSHKIKTTNPWAPSNYTPSVIYNAHYMTADLQGRILVLSFGFGWDEKYGYIKTCTLKIDLSTATFYTGYWSKQWGKWEHYGPKEVITIKDDNGMDLFSKGEQRYNQGTEQDLISEFKISFGTEPIANRIINEIYIIQERFKDKEPWLLPEPEHQKQAVEVTTPKTNNSQKIKKGRTNKNNGSKNSNTKKVGKYVQ